MVDRNEREVKGQSAAARGRPGPGGSEFVRWKAAGIRQEETGIRSAAFIIRNRQVGMSGRAWTLLVALAFLWGGTFFFQEIALRGLPPLTIVFGRVALAATALLLFVRLRGLSLPREPHVLGAFLVMGLLNNAIPFGLIVYGQTGIASGLASILNATTPLFAVLLAHALTEDERLSARRLGGVVLGLAGVAVIVGPDVLADADGALLAKLAVLDAAFSYALAGIFGRRFRGLPPPVIAAGQTSASTLLLLPVVLLVDRPFALPWPDAEVVGAVAALALPCTALAYILYFRILALAGATNLLLVTLLIPVTALLLGVLVLGEPVTARQLMGMALIGTGLVTIDGRLWALRRLLVPALPPAPR